MERSPLTRVFVVYNTKYGNTKFVAEKIIEGIREVEGVEAALSDVDELNLEEMADYDALLIGSPNHVGRPARSIAKLIGKLGKLDLKAKQIAVFDTYLGKDFEKVVKKMEKEIREKAPRLRLITPGLSIRVAGMTGPVVDGELAKCKAFGEKIAGQLET